MPLTIVPSAASGTYPLVVSFTLTSNTDNALSTTWEFGDGLTASGIAVQHTFHMPGAYLVKVTEISQVACMATATATTTITVTEPIKVFKLDKCYHFGMGGTQGSGWSQFTGTYWPFAPIGVHGLPIVDTKSQAHQVVFDNNWSCWKEINEFDGPGESSGLLAKAYVYTDDNRAGAAQEVTTQIQLGEVTAVSEANSLKMDSVRFFFRPEKESNQSASGYDAAGFRTNQQVDVSLFLDGSTTAIKRTYDIQPFRDRTDSPQGCEVVFDQPIRKAKRIRVQLDTATSEYFLTGVRGEYVQVADDEAPQERAMAESANQLAFATPTMWVTRGSSLLYDRVSHSTITISGYVGAGTTGPDGRTLSAYQFSSGTGVVTFGGVSLTLTSATVVLWITNTGVDLAIGSGGAVAMTQYGDDLPGGSWALMYLTGVTGTGNLKLTYPGAGNRNFFDVRVYNNTTLTTAQLRDYYDDMKNNSGRNYLPPF